MQTQKKHPLMFSIITPAFFGRFLYFLYQWKEKWIPYNLLTYSLDDVIFAIFVTLSVTDLLRWFCARRLRMTSTLNVLHIRCREPDLTQCTRRVSSGCSTKSTVGQCVTHFTVVICCRFFLLHVCFCTIDPEIVGGVVEVGGLTRQEDSLV